MRKKVFFFEKMIFWIGREEEWKNGGEKKRKSGRKEERKSGREKGRKSEIYNEISAKKNA